VAISAVAIVLVLGPGPEGPGYIYDLAARREVISCQRLLASPLQC
jgi:hypothetical protein